MHAARPAPVRLVGPALAIAAVGVLASLAGCRGGKAQETAAAPEPTAAKAAAASQAGVRTTSNPLKNAYFGEQHVHTAYSLDAYIGGARLTPDGAYRFAKGEEVDVGGQKLRLRRPLDWAAVTDHAEYIGEMYSTMTTGAPGHDQRTAAAVAWPRVRRGTREVVHGDRDRAPQSSRSRSTRRSTRASRPREPAGRTSSRPRSGTTSRAGSPRSRPSSGAPRRRARTCTATSSSAARTCPTRPMSSVDIDREDGLWEWMDGLEKPGMRVIAIPHNSNASKGMMFAAMDPAGKPIDRAYAEMRSRFEPLIEMMQIKGNSEVHRAFWPNDEFAGLRERRLDPGVQRAEVQPAELRPRRLIQGPGLAEVARSQSLPLRLRRRLGQPQRHARQHGRGQLHAGSHGAADATVDRRRNERDRRLDQGQGPEPGCAHRRVGRAEHARGDLGRAEAARDLRHQRHAHPGALLRRRGPCRHGRGPGAHW